MEARVASHGWSVFQFGTASMYPWLVPRPAGASTPFNPLAIETAAASREASVCCGLGGADDVLRVNRDSGW